LVQIVSLRSLSIGVRAPQATFFVKKNALQARLIKQNALQARLIKQNAPQAGFSN